MRIIGSALGYVAHDMAAKLTYVPVFDRATPPARCTLASPQTAGIGSHRMLAQLACDPLARPTAATGCVNKSRMGAPPRQIGRGDVDVVFDSVLARRTCPGQSWRWRTSSAATVGPDANSPPVRQRALPSRWGRVWRLERSGRLLVIERISGVIQPVLHWKSEDENVEDNANVKGYGMFGRVFRRVRMNPRFAGTDLQSYQWRGRGTSLRGLLIRSSLA